MGKKQWQSISEESCCRWQVLQPSVSYKVPSWLLYLIVIMAASCLQYCHKEDNVHTGRNQRKCAVLNTSVHVPL